MDKCLVVDGFSRRRHTLFQAFAGLPRTGVLDARTIEMMNTPRWVSDLIFAQYFGKCQSLQYGGKDVYWQECYMGVLKH